MHRSETGWRLPARLLLTSDTLQRGWTATGFAPMCTASGQAAIARGEIPQFEVTEFSRASVDFWAAPISYILVSIAQPAYDGYQRKLLERAAGLRAKLAAIAELGEDGDRGLVEVAR